MASSPTLIVPGGTPAASTQQPRGIFGRLRQRATAARDAATAARQAELKAEFEATQPPASATQTQSFATAAASGTAQRTRRRAAAGNAGVRKAKQSKNSSQLALAPAGIPLMLIGGTT